MLQMITIHNADLTVIISTSGAEIQSVRTPSGTEFLWEGDPAIWAGHAPILFPICGGLKDDAYTLNGVTHSLQKHGFIQSALFEVVRMREDEVVLSSHETKETLASFPFRFVFTVTFRLEGNRLVVTYQVENRDQNTMYFSMGGHEAYATPEGVNAYEIVFEKDESLATNEIYGNLLGHEKKPLVSGKVLPLKEAYFSVDALVLESLRSRAVTLRRRDGGRSVRVTFPGFDHLLLWQTYKAPYLCIEPWSGMPDFVDVDGNIAHKPYITALDGGQTYTLTHTITFSEGDQG